MIHSFSSYSATFLASLFFLVAAGFSEEPISVSGIYPSLTMFNDEGECGTGAVVPWADRLWVITYAPHKPKGSSDKLYEVTPNLKQIVRNESIGGTPANRMIHKESEQLFIGPYAIGSKGQVRTIPVKDMFGRHTANARHLTDPARKILYATMEEGVYEVDVKSLAVKELWADEATKGSSRKSGLPGYHGKGFYSGQGVYVYANNGERGNAARTKPETASGVLAEWDGKADAWTVIRRNQFTEVTGPGGIHGNANAATDPIWTIGWDHRSLIMGVRMPETGWTFYRLPKGSHSYDGAHGWNTEWPRIREIGEDDFLMTMHGTFWRFPKNFTPQSSAGIAPRSNYLKVIGDFAKWNDRIVFGCDDTAKNEFLNKRKAKGEIAAPQSQSNLWFVKPEQLDQFGPAIGRGAVWVNEAVKAGVASDPYLFSGYEHRCLHLTHDMREAVKFNLEIDRAGNGQWEKFKQIEVPASGYGFVTFDDADQGTWIRVSANHDLNSASAVFSYRQNRLVAGDTKKFAGIARVGDRLTGGIVRALPNNQRVLGFAALDHKGNDLGYYILDEQLRLKRTADIKALEYTKKHAAIPSDVLQVDEASVIYTDDDGKRWRLPKVSAMNHVHPLGDYRVAREVATERDLFHAAGTFYELPARNAGGFAKVRPVTTHQRMVHDFCSYRGLFVVSGVATDAPDDNPHIIRSDDGETALWVGAIDDMWQLGKPRGIGGPWRGTHVKAGEPSDPYLMTGYDKKMLMFRASTGVNLKIEVDLTGDGDWQTYQKVPVQNGGMMRMQFPDDFSAYWVRFVVDRDCKATAELHYR